MAFGCQFAKVKWCRSCRCRSCRAATSARHGSAPERKVSARRARCFFFKLLNTEWVLILRGISNKLAWQSVSPLLHMFSCPHNKCSSSTDALLHVLRKKMEKAFPKSGSKKRMLLIIAMRWHEDTGAESSTVPRLASSCGFLPLMLCSDRMIRLCIYSSSRLIHDVVSTFQA